MLPPLLKWFYPPHFFDAGKNRCGEGGGTLVLPARVGAPAELAAQEGSAMRGTSSIDVSCGYTLTETGLGALTDNETCECTDLLVIDGATRCRVCGTCFGIVYGFYRAPKRKWREVGLSR
jgi:hypothetical protein